MESAQQYDSGSECDSGNESGSSSSWAPSESDRDGHVYRTPSSASAPAPACTSTPVSAAASAPIHTSNHGPSQPVTMTAAIQADDDDYLAPNVGSLMASDGDAEVPSSLVPSSLDVISYTGHNSVQPSRKPYTSVVRLSKAKNRPSRSSKWLQDLKSITAPKFHRTDCCKKNKCFRRANFDFFVENAERILAALSSSRRTILQSFLGSDKTFRFDGKAVCVLFLKRCFHFSTVLISEVSTGQITRNRSTPSISSLRGSSRSTNSSSYASTHSTTSTSALATQVRKKEAIVSFVQRIAEDCGDYMPNRTEVHLPFYQYHDIFPIFQCEFKILYPNLPPVSPRYFRRVWKLACPQIKVMKVSRFTTCDICDELRVALRQKILSGASTSAIKAQRKAHLDFVSMERFEYQKKKDRARLHGGEYCSIILDGADQSAFGLPHFTTSTKTQRGHALKVKLVGLLEHQLENKLFLFSMTQEHATGANHVVEVLHRFFNVKRSNGPLPPKLFVQLDNCSRENKNHYVMGYFEFLVASKVFQSVEVGFLPVGHTHEDVDQAFSQTSARLRVRNAITLDDLHNELRGTYGGNVQIVRMRRLANWSGLCDQEHCIHKVDRITHWRYFMFSASDSDSPSDTKHRTTMCHVKKKSNDAWVRLFSDSVRSTKRGFLKSYPCLRKMPDLQISCPDGLSKVTSRLESEDGRVNDARKMILLHSLRDFVFQDRVDKCHWDLHNSTETEHIPSVDESTVYTVGNSSTDIFLREGNADEHVLGGDQVEGTHHPCEVNEGIDIIEEDAADSEPENKFEYVIGSFVVVQAETGDSDETEEKSGKGANDDGRKEYWVGAVENRGTSKYVTHLRVHWYDDEAAHEQGDDIFTYKFDPCYQLAKTKRNSSSSTSRPTRAQLQHAWCDVIHTDTVVVSFDNLTKRRTLPLSVQKKLS